MCKRSFLSLLFSGVAGLGLVLQGAAASAAGGTSTAKAVSSASLGVTTTLTTSGYHFLVANLVTPPGVVPTPPTFQASFALIDHTSAPIEFQLPLPKVGPGVMAALLPKVIFSVYDSNGKLVWVSSENPDEVVLDDIPLPAGSAWRQNVQVPLKVNGQFLSGDYTLVATLNGTPDFSATASFQVQILNTAVVAPAKH